MFIRLGQRVCRSALALMLSISCASADKLNLSVAFPLPSEMRPMHEEIARRFMEQNRTVAITFQSPAATYDELVQRMMREALVGQTPDVAFHAYNRVQLLVERGLPISLDARIAEEKNWATMGYLPAMLDLARINDRVYGLPFNTSTPVIYYNLDLVRRAGGDAGRLPATWTAVIDLARRIKALGSDTQSIYFDYYDSAGNWTFLALVESHGGTMMTGDKLAFDGAEGLAALNILKEIGAAGMVDTTRNQALQSFRAGTLGILVGSTSFLKGLTDGAQGRFEIKTGPFPISAPSGRLPAGGNAAMIFAKDPAKQTAAWEYVKFATGPIGQTIAVRSSGYMPNNTIAIDDPALLGTFYQQSPNHRTSVEQLAFLTGFFNFPGPNSIKITEVIRDHLRNVVTQRQDPADALPVIARDVRALLPRP